MQIRKSNVTAELNLKPNKLEKRFEYGRFLASDAIRGSRKVIVLDVHPYVGFRLHLAGKRFEVFRDQFHCVTCDLVPSVIIAERWSHEPYPVWRLYGVRNGHLVLFTLDHIIPKSLGGSDGIENMQIMCFDCNQKKGNHSHVNPFYEAILFKKR